MKWLNLVETSKRKIQVNLIGTKKVQLHYKGTNESIFFILVVNNFKLILISTPKLNRIFKESNKLMNF